MHIGSYDNEPATVELMHRYMMEKCIPSDWNGGYDNNIELVVVGGESDINARVFNFDWALNIREQCVRKNVNFEFRQCGTYTVKDGKQYKILTKYLCKQAKLAGIDYKTINE